MLIIMMKRNLAPVPQLGWLKTERQHVKKGDLMELFDVLVFCSIYSGVVIYSLWLTISDRLGTRLN